MEEAGQAGRDFAAEEEGADWRPGGAGAHFDDLGDVFGVDEEAPEVARGLACAGEGGDRRSRDGTITGDS